jgi:hypothetical protein
MYPKGTTAKMELVSAEPILADSTVHAQILTIK